MSQAAQELQQQIVLGERTLARFLHARELNEKARVVVAEIHRNKPHFLLQAWNVMKKPSVWPIMAMYPATLALFGGMSIFAADETLDNSQYARRLRNRYDRKPLPSKYEEHLKSMEKLHGSGHH
eukprot:GILI01001411.1.p1 GENE.GILI01001411.1~~GILI01001411.1.p1  ORF type:complete len:124 (+),score=44.96 GILI01001411.1:56-427(+)